MLGLQPRAVPAPAPSSFPSYAPLPGFSFEVVHRSRKPGSRARVGRIHTPHGVIDTPGYVPVGTNGALKGLTNEQAADAGVQLMFANTYHLLVHPGSDVIAAAGGLHNFIGRSGPLITDSGGFQVFSLGRTSDDDTSELKRRSNAKSKYNGATVLSVRGRSHLRSHLDA